jgi:hypothetical protein
MNTSHDNKYACLCFAALPHCAGDSQQRQRHQVGQRGVGWKVELNTHNHWLAL